MRFRVFKLLTGPMSVGLALMVAGCGSKTETTSAIATDTNATDSSETMSDNMTADDEPMNGGMMANDTMVTNATTTSAASSSGAALPYCDVVDAFIAVEDCNRMAIQKAHLAQGIAAFLPPDVMTVGVPRDLTLAIGSSDNQAKFEDALGISSGPPSTVKVELSRYMKATLSGGGFRIQSLDDASKDLGASHFGVWQWRVTPTAAGNQVLMLRVETNAMDSNGSPVAFDLASKSFPITVDVTEQQQRVDIGNSAGAMIDLGTGLLISVKNLLLALAAAILALAGVYYAIAKFGKPPIDKDEK